GGGRLGSTWAYKKDANREYLLEHGQKIPDTTAIHTNPLDYAYLITNIHGGVFRNNIYGGAAGSKDLKRPLVYGLKMVNMDAGKVAVSLYGGSQSVDDGYPWECKNKDNTTKRPSSIVNVTGGTIENNIYGGGYLGLTYGSIYLNIGTDAIDSCVAYTQRYGSSAQSAGDSVYWQFKPGEEGSLSDDLGKTDLLLNRSVYVGSNWGNAGGSSDFTKSGFHGGESKIIIDGKGYNTDNDELNNDPEMNIAKSVFCAGTSVSGGDVQDEKDIDIWNYGSIVNCQPTRKLESVQRSDNLMFHNSAIELTGAIDATSAYQSIPYSLNNVSELDYRGYNVIQYDATVTNLYEMYFYDEDMNASGNPEETTLEYLNDQDRFDQVPNACNNDATICDKINIVNPDDPNRQYTLMIINNGVDFTVGQDDEGTINYGGVNGFGYIATPPEYSSSVYAHLYDGSYGKGGFVSPCWNTNQWTNMWDGDDEVGEIWTD
ncbi:MAG: hypothetical protein J6X59_08290, partial [Bacteroidales bacterium]|nr:hypothetical protein [Bacteroidales bacterium]